MILCVLLTNESPAAVCLEKKREHLGWGFNWLGVGGASSDRYVIQKWAFPPENKPMAAHSDMYVVKAHAKELICIKTVVCVWKSPWSLCIDGYSTWTFQYNSTVRSQFTVDCTAACGSCSSCSCKSLQLHSAGGGGGGGGLRLLTTHPFIGNKWGENRAVQRAFPPLVWTALSVWRQQNLPEPPATGAALTEAIA